MVDRLPTKLIVISVSLMQAVVCVGLTLTSSPVLTVLLVALLNAGQALSSPAWFTVIPAIVPEDRQPAALSTSQAAASGAAIVGPAAGGLIVGLGGTTTALLVNGATFLVLAGCAALLQRQRRPERESASETPRRETLAGVAFLRSDRVLLTLLVVLTVFVVAVGAVNVAEVFLITRVLGANATAYGAVGAAFASGLLVGALLARRQLRDTAKVREVSYSILVMAVGLGACGLSPNVASVAVASAFVGIGNGVLNVRAQQLLMSRTQSAVLGRVMAALNACVSAASIVALVLGGALLQVMSPRAIFVSAALVGVAMLPLLARASGLGDQVAHGVRVLVRAPQRTDHPADDEGNEGQDHQHPAQRVELPGRTWQGRVDA